MRSRAIALLLTLSACGSASHGGSAVGGSGGAPMEVGGASSAGAGAASIDMPVGMSGADGTAMGGASGAPAISPPPPDPCIANGTCAPNTWVNVTPDGIMIPEEGLRSVVADPKRPSDLFMSSGAAGIWKSADYGNSWTLINQGFGYVAQGLCLAVLGTEPRTLIVSEACACGRVHKSTDGGATFTSTGGNLPSDLYSFAVDPYDSSHLISGFHEMSGIAESNDAGDTWHLVSDTGFPAGGVSWFPSFIDTGVAETTSKSWIAIAQNAGSPAITRDGGATWAIPAGLEGLTHPHGNAQIFQRGSSIFVPGGGGPGDGVYRSTDWGATFVRATTAGAATPSVAAAVAWGTPDHVYSMYAWSCFGCAISPNFLVGSATGDAWSSPGVPATMLMGADHVAVTYDGNHYIFVAAMRSTGLWRYVEQ